MEDAALNAIAKRRDIAIRTILRTKEAEADQYLPQEVSTRLRKVVLDEINDLYTISIELLKTCSADVDINQIWLDKLEQKISGIVHAAVNGDG